jgi:hypothetical protein
MKASMKLPRVTHSFKTPNWPLIVLYALVFAILGGALFWRLGTLLPGYASVEAATYQRSFDVHALLDNPINAPFLLAVKAVSHIIQDNLLVTRLVAAGFGTIVLGAFAILVRRWHGQWTAVIGTLLFGLSAWFLHTARLGTPEVMLFGIFLLVACGYWLRRTNHWLALLSCFAVVAALLYTPGMIWFIVFGLLWQWKTIDAVFKKHLAVVTIGAVFLCVAIAPVGLALYKHHDLIMPLLGLPEHWPSLLAMLENLIRVPLHLFIHNEANPVSWLGTAPILDVFSLTMFVLGGYVYLKKIRLLRTPLFISTFILTVLLMAIGSTVTFTVLIPLVYLLVAAGVSQLIDLWLDTFPRNPIARTVGWMGIILVVGLACTFQLTHYFIGWPKAAATHEVFTIKQ